MAVLAGALALAHVGMQALLIARVLLREHREPASRIAWVLVIAAMPVVGILAYLLVGEARLGRARVRRLSAVAAALPPEDTAPGTAAARAAAHVPKAQEHLFRLATSVSGFVPVGGNRGHLLPGSRETIAAQVADIDAAREHVHVLFYIWLTDASGRAVAEALARAARRGVACRAMADDLGSRDLIRSEHWTAMAQSGVRLARALPIGNPIGRIASGRIDLRNHRKIVVIDGRITYCGSQNCADPEFRVKPRFAPWVDAVIRFEGPVARQSQALFAADWSAHTGEDLGPLLMAPLESAADRFGDGFTAAAFGTGPTARASAVSEMFGALIHAARRELVITTPYYVPDESMQAALCTSPRRGVTTSLILPARNDSPVVAAASRSYYKELLDAGVRLYEYPLGLLHTKSLTLDGEITLIGSANMDRRSFDLNYENQILLCDRSLTADVRARQQSYIDASRRVTVEEVAAWSRRKQLWNNAVAMMGPVL